MLMRSSCAAQLLPCRCQRWQHGHSNTSQAYVNTSCQCYGHRRTSLLLCGQLNIDVLSQPVSSKRAMGVTCLPLNKNCLSVGLCLAAGAKLSRSVKPFPLSQSFERTGTLICVMCG